MKPMERFSNLPDCGAQQPNRGLADDQSQSVFYRSVLTEAEYGSGLPLAVLLLLVLVSGVAALLW